MLSGSSITIDVCGICDMTRASERRLRSLESKLKATKAKLAVERQKPDPRLKEPALRAEIAQKQKKLADVVSQTLLGLQLSCAALFDFACC